MQLGFDKEVTPLTSIHIYISGSYGQQFAYKHVVCLCTDYLYNLLAPPISSAIWVVISALDDFAMSLFTQPI